MANGNDRIDFRIGFSTDESGLKKLQANLGQIMDMGKDANPLKPLTQSEQDAIQKAGILKDALQKAYNAELGTTNITKLNNELKKSGTTINECRNSFQSMGQIGANAYNLLGTQILSTNVKIKQTNKLLDKMAITMANTVRYGISSSIFNNVTGAIQRAVGYAEDLDESLGAIRIVSGKSAENMQEFAKYANDAAKNLGSTTLDYTDASLIYYQQGLGEEEVKARTDVTLEMANVLGQSASEVSDSMTAIWNNFYDGSKSLEYYGDVITALGASTASSAAEISEGLEKFAAVADTVGLSYEYATSALATVVAETRQSADVVGTAFKTLFARIQDLELGETLDDGTTLGKYSQALETAGINIKDQNGQLKKMDDILNEMGSKWKTLSSDEQVALAQTVAGTRQYTQLVALMDNWDKFSENLQTASDATGTLQEKQAIYLETTEAKLNKLKTTWQDLYGELINKDELDAGIEGLTNLVQVFENFFESFGGGIKSIGALGIVLSNVFNKQLTTYITSARDRMKEAADEAVLYQAKIDEIKAGSFTDENGNSVDPDSMQGKGYEANFESQKNNASAIAEVSKVLSEQETIRLTTMQAEIGALEEQKAKHEFIVTEFKKEAEEIAKAGSASLEVQEIYEKGYEILQADSAEISKQAVALEEEAEKAEKVATAYEKAKDAIELQRTNIKVVDNEEGKRLKSLQGIVNDLNKSNGLTERQRETLNKILSANIGIEDKEKLLNKYLERQLGLRKKEAEAAKEVSKAVSNQDKANQHKNISDNKQSEFDDAIKKAGENKTLSDSIISVTSALSSMAMAWSTVNGLIQIWNDESASFGEKMTQTLMTLGMAIPLVVKGFSDFKNSIGGVVVATKLSVAETKKEIASKATEAAMEKLAADAKATGVVFTEEETAAISGKILAEQLENVTLGDFIALKATQIAEILASIPAWIAEQVELLKTATAMGILEIAAWPVTVVIAALVAILATLCAGLALAGVSFAAYTKHLKEVAEKSQSLADSKNELYQAQKKEKENVDALSDSIDALGDKIQEQGEYTDELRVEAYNLCNQYGLENEAVIALTGSYEALKEAIRAASEEEANELYESAKRTKESQDVAIENDIWSKLSMGERDTVGGHKTIDLKGFNGILNQDEEDMRKELQKTFGVNFFADAGHVNLEEFVKAATENKDLLNDILLKYRNTDAEDAANQLFNILTDESESINKSIDAVEQLKLTSKELAAYGLDTSQLDNIDSTDTYNEQVQNYAEAYLDKMIEAGLVDKDNEEAVNAAKEEGEREGEAYLLGYNSALVKYASETHSEDTQVVNAKVLEYKDKYDLNDEEITWITAHMDMSEAYGDFEEFVKDAKSLADKTASQASLDIVAGIINETTDELNAENINKLYNSTDFAKFSGIEQEIFEKLDLATQLNLIDQYYDNIYQKALKIQEITPTVEEIGQNTLNNGDEIVHFSTYDGDKKYQKNGYATFSEVNEGNGMKISEIGDTAKEEIEQDMLAIQHAIEESEYGAEEAISSLFGNLASSTSDALSGANNAMDEFGQIMTDKSGDVSKSLNELSDEQLQWLSGIAQATGRTEEQVLELAYAKKASDDYAKSVKATGDALEASGKKIDDNVDKYTQATAKLAALKQKMSDINSSIDDIQSAYNSLNSIMDDYNSTGILTMDNLQTLLSMDTQYLACLQIENGQMSLNTATMQAAALAKLDEAEATAVQSAMAELEALSQNEANAASEASVAANQAAASGAQAAAQAAREGAAAWDSYWASVAGGYEGSEAGKKAIGDALKTKLQAIDQVRSQIKSGKFGSTMKSGGGSGGSGSKKEDKEHIREDIDAYHKWEQQIKACTNALNELTERQEHLKGKQLIKNLDAQTAALERQFEAQKNLNGQYKAQAEYEKSRLMSYGVGASFDANGNISNYVEMMQNAQAQYNAAVDAYNKSKTDANEVAVENAKNVYDDIKQTVSNYEEALDGMQQAQQKINELMQKQADVALAKLQAEWEIEFQIDTHKAERRMKKFIKDLNKDFTKAINNWQEQFDSAFDLFTNGKLTNDIEGQISKMTDIMNWMDDIQSRSNADGEYEFQQGDMFTSASDAAEYLLELEEELEEMADELKTAYEDAWDAYVEGIEQACDEFERLDGIIEGNMSKMEKYKTLMEMSYGNANSTENQIDFYNAQAENKDALIESKKAQNQMWAEQFNAIAKENRTTQLTFDDNGYIDQTKVNIAEMDEAQQKMYDKMISNEEAIFDAYVERAEIAKEIKDLQIDAALKEVSQAMFGTDDFEYFKQQWEDALKWQERYYDGQERIYEIESLANKYDTSISNAKTLKAQEKLNKAKEQELEYLKARENLSKDEIMLAEKRYQLTLAEIALEEAQNNKNTMKLTRNEEGNWSYQYVANEDDVAQKQQDVIDKTYEYYEAAKEAYQNAVSYSFEIYETYTERYTEIMQNTEISDAEREARLETLNEQTKKNIVAISDETKEYVTNTAEATSLLIQDVIEEGNIAITDLTEEQKIVYSEAQKANALKLYETRIEMQNENSALKAHTKTCLEETTEIFGQEAGKVVTIWENQSKVIKDTLTTASSTGISAVKNYQSVVNQCARAIGLDLTSVKSSFASLTASTNSAKEASRQYGQQTSASLTQSRTQLAQIKTAWDQVRSAITQVISQLSGYISRTQQAVAAANNLAAAINRAAAAQKALNAAQNGGGGGGSSATAKEEAKSIVMVGPYEIWRNTDGKYYRLEAGESFDLSEAQLLSDSQQKYYQKKYGYATGGYTGSWSDGDPEAENGKLAWLHQKELVLNANDTKNILDAVNAIRDLQTSSIDNAIMNGIADMITNAIKTNTSYNNITNNNSSEMISQNNVFENEIIINNGDVEEIKNAILNLPNLASQYIARK